MLGVDGRCKRQTLFKGHESKTECLERWKTPGRRSGTPPTITHLPYRVSGSTLTAVRRFQLLARWPGTHSRIFSGIQRAAQTVLGVYLKRTYSRVTSASSALALGVVTITRYTNPRTQSLRNGKRCKKVPDLNCEVQYLLLEVVDLK